MLSKGKLSELSILITLLQRQNYSVLQRVRSSKLKVLNTTTKCFLPFSSMNCPKNLNYSYSIDYFLLTLKSGPLQMSQLDWSSRRSISTYYLRQFIRRISLLISISLANSTQQFYLDLRSGLPKSQKQHQFSHAALERCLSRVIYPGRMTNRLSFSICQSRRRISAYFYLFSKIRRLRKKRMIELGVFLRMRRARQITFCKDCTSLKIRSVTTYRILLFLD